MNLTLVCVKQGKESTLSELYLDDQFVGYGLEDAVRKTKIKGSTAIPPGKYRLGLNTYGAMNARYKRKFPKIHRGMIEIMQIPNFNYVYIHIGNHIGDTSGCVLVGNKMALVDGDYEIYQSKKAYVALYEKLVEMMVNGEVFIEVISK
ncbi:DUF5675 family protein [Sphingobacterium kitahiroshimense]|uniref:DUF5675 family protein n=1 Tax=Sphingobacterium kitahiroshimense TaxID=470446 RepID=A0ABV0BX05_9SPHI